MNTLVCQQGLGLVCEMKSCAGGLQLQRDIVHKCTPPLAYLSETDHQAPIF